VRRASTESDSGTVLSAGLFVEGKRRRARHRASVDMHVLPFVVSLVPHATLLALLGMRYALSAGKQKERGLIIPLCYRVVYAQPQKNLRCFITKRNPYHEETDHQRTVP